METGNATEAAARTYNVNNRNTARSIAAENLAKPAIEKSMAQLLDEAGLTDEALAKKHKQLLNAEKYMVKGDKVIKAPDNTAQNKSLETAYKIKSKFPAEKLDVNENKTIKVIIAEDRELLEGQIVEDKEEVESIV